MMTKSWCALGLVAALAAGGCDNPVAIDLIDKWREHGHGQGPGKPDPQPDPGPTLLGLTTENDLVTFSANRPERVSAPVAITGLAEGEWIVGITIRPSNGALYGVGSTSRLYRIDHTTGVATAVGPGPFTPALVGDNFGVDFNPTVDRIRVVSDEQQNLRLHPDLGTVVDGDPVAAGVQGDADLNPAGAVSAAAYTNSVVGATTTTLFTIDHDADTLLRQGGPDSMPPSPNTGLLTTIGELGVDTDAPVGLDIAPVTNTAYAVLQVSCAKLYTIDLVTGAAKHLGDIDSDDQVVAIAVLP
jgi:hypothetical protein